MNNIKIAVASENGVVTGHFGHCEAFHIFEIVGSNIVSENKIQNPGHKPGFLPNFLGELGINVIISGGMGGGAVALFNEKKIDVVLGASGNSRDVVESYIKGALQSTGSICNDHAHHGSCGN